MKSGHELRCSALSYSDSVVIDDINNNRNRQWNTRLFLKAYTATTLAR